MPVECSKPFPFLRTQIIKWLDTNGIAFFTGGGGRKSFGGEEERKKVAEILMSAKRRASGCGRAESQFCASEFDDIFRAALRLFRILFVSPDSSQGIPRNTINDIIIS